MMSGCDSKPFPWQPWHCWNVHLSHLSIILPSHQVGKCPPERLSLNGSALREEALEAFGLAKVGLDCFASPECLKTNACKGGKRTGFGDVLWRQDVTNETQHQFEDACNIVQI